MALVPIKTGTFWSNDGTAAITGLASADDLWLVPGGTSVTTTPDSTVWKLIDLTGCSHLLLQYDSNLVATGGTTASASGQWIMTCIGSAAPPTDTTLWPKAVTASPESFSTTAEYAFGQVPVMWAAKMDVSTSAETGSTAQSMFGNLTVNVDGGFIAEDQGATPDVAAGMRTNYIWRVGTNPNIGTISGPTSSQASVPFELKLNGIQYIWLAVAANSTFTGATVGNIRLKASFKWIGLGEVSTVPTKVLWT